MMNADKNNKNTEYTAEQNKTLSDGSLNQVSGGFTCENYGDGSMKPIQKE